MQDAKEMQLTRTGKPPISFIGIKIGTGTTQRNNSTRWTEVNIYTTKGGKLIASVLNRTQWQGERDFTDAKSCATASEVMDCLKDDEGKFGVASQDALESAAENNPEFAAAFIEKVD